MERNPSPLTSGQELFNKDSLKNEAGDANRMELGLPEEVHLPLSPMHISSEVNSIKFTSRQMRKLQALQAYP